MDRLIGLLAAASGSGVTTVDVVSVVVAAVAAAAAIIALVFSVKSNNKANGLQTTANDIQGRLLKIEEARDAERTDESQRARLQGRLEHRTHPTYHFYCLLVENVGASKATGIRVELDGRPLSGCPGFIGQSVRGDLAAMSKHEYPMSLDAETTAPSHILIEWNDTAGGDRWDSDVSLTTVIV